MSDKIEYEYAVQAGYRTVETVELVGGGGLTEERESVNWQQMGPTYDSYDGARQQKSKVSNDAWPGREWVVESVTQAEKVLDTFKRYENFRIRIVRRPKSSDWEEF